MTESSPPPVEDRPGAPWPFRILWRVVRGLLVAGVILWIIITLGVNVFLKNILEQDLSKNTGGRVTIGAMRAGWDFMRPTIAAMDIKLSDAPDTPQMKTGNMEFGFYIHGTSVNPDQPDMLYYAGIDDIDIGGKPFGSYEAKFRLPGIGGSGPAADDVVVEELRGDYRGAKLEGSGSKIRHEIKAELTAENVDYSALAEGVKGGKAHVRLNLTSDSRSLIQKLSGHATLVGGDGKLEGNSLNLWAGSLLTAFLPGQDKDTHLNCAVADFDIKDGIAQSRTVIIDTDKATITGKGTVDLVRQRVDMRFTPQTKGVAAVSLATPVVVSGPFGNITAHPDATGVAEKMGGLILGAVASPVALLPFLHMGGGNPCQKYLETKSP